MCPCSFISVRAVLSNWLPFVSAFLEDCIYSAMNLTRSLKFNSFTLLTNNY
jgi:hypothetical protein